MRRFLFFLSIFMPLIFSMVQATEEPFRPASAEEIREILDSHDQRQRAYEGALRIIKLEASRISKRGFQKALFYVMKYFNKISYSQKEEVVNAIIERLKNKAYSKSFGLSLVYRVPEVDFVSVLFSNREQRHRKTITDLAVSLVENKEWRSWGTQLFLEVLSTLNEMTELFIRLARYDAVFEMDDRFGKNSIWRCFLQRFTASMSLMSPEEIKESKKELLSFTETRIVLLGESVEADASRFDRDYAMRATKANERIEFWQARIVEIFGGEHAYI